MRGDRIQLQQVVINLLLNAFDAMKERPRIERIATLRVRLQDSDLLVLVRDRGVGLTSDKLERIFMPFFTTKRSQGGTGLGLHVVFNIVNQTLGGTIKVASEPGHGTSFTIRF